MELSIEAQMNSLNGGIPMWIQRLADILAEHGVEQTLKGAIADAEQSPGKLRKTHLHFLIRGIKSINRSELVAAVEPLKEYPHRLRALVAQWGQQFDTLKRTKAEWDIAAAHARTEVSAWQQWASAAVATARKEAFPWAGADWSIDFQVQLEFSGATSALSSHENLAGNIDFFNEKIASIRAVIERSYVNGSFDEALSPVALDEAVCALLDKQEEVGKCQELLDMTNVEWDKCSHSYSTLRSSVVHLLQEMPESARVALFWLCRPDLKYQSMQA